MPLVPQKTSRPGFILIKPACLPTPPPAALTLQEQEDRYRRVNQRGKRQRSEFLYRQYVWNYKLAHPCVDCGESDPVVLEFDHRAGVKKEFHIGSQGRTIERFLLEVSKCDVRCANCHRRKTAADRGHHKEFWNAPHIDNILLEIDLRNLSSVILTALHLLEDDRDGDALKILKSAFPAEQTLPTGAPPSGGMSA